MDLHLLDQEEEDEAAMQAFWCYRVYVLAALAASTPNKIHRNPSRFDQRLQWEEFQMKCGTHQDFHRHLWMSHESFNKLLGYISDDITVNPEMANIRGGAIILEICLYITIRYLAGGSYS
jgi:hypothetical protein